MADANPPSFEEWVEYCFALPEEQRVKREQSGKRCVTWHEKAEPAHLVGLLTRLFEAPGWVANRFSVDQIAAGIWFIFGCTSSYFVSLRHPSVAIAEQARCVCAVATCYTDLFDRVCCNRGAEPDVEFFERSKIDGAVYMMWDMDCFEGTLAHPQDNPHLVEPGLFVLESALMRCRTSTCRVSALHGIGHLYSRFEDEKHPLAERLRNLIDRFVASTPLPDWLAEYAACARDGYVQ